MKAIPVACPSFQFYVPSTPQYGIKLPMKSPLPPPLPPPPPQQHHCPASPHPRTSVIVHGISSPRTFELCPICPIPSILPKLQAILAADRRECWIPASVIDIATAGREGMYLGWRYRAPSSSSSFSSSSVLPPSRTWQRWVWKEGTKEEARKRDVEQEDGGGGDEELKRLCEVLIQMAGQCRHVELRLCRGSKEVVSSPVAFGE